MKGVLEFEAFREGLRGLLKASVYRTPARPASSRASSHAASASRSGASGASIVSLRPAPGGRSLEPLRVERESRARRACERLGHAALAVERVEKDRSAERR